MNRATKVYTKPRAPYFNELIHNTTTAHIDNPLLPKCTTFMPKIATECAPLGLSSWLLPLVLSRASWSWDKKRPSMYNSSALRTAHFSSSEDSPSLNTAGFFSDFRRMRLNHSTVVSKEHVERWNIKRSNDACSEKLIKKEQAASRASLGPKKRRVGPRKK